MAKSGLGRGLNSLIPNRINNEIDEAEKVKEVFDDSSEKVRQLEIDRIAVNPWQPREHFDHSQLEDLVNSIKQHGILQPLIVSPAEGGNFQLIAGERRLKAASILELKTVPCLVRDTEKLEKLELALIENIQRANLNPIEEAKAYQKLIDEFDLTQEEVGSRVGKKRATVSNALRLLDLSEEIQQALKENKITTGHAKVILSAEAEEVRQKLFKKILKFNLTVRETEGEVKSAKGGPASGGKGHEKDIEIKEKEDILRKALGTKVTINKKGEAGSITIDFYSQEELNGIIDKIKE